MLMMGIFLLSQAQTSIQQNHSEVMTYSEAPSVEQAVLSYILAGDERDVDGLTAITDESFRVLFNDPVKGTLSNLDKATYVGLVQKGVIGGVARAVEILDLDIYQGVNAQVKTRLVSEKATFYNYFSLVKTENKWWVAQDLVIMEANE